MLIFLWFLLIAGDLSLAFLYKGCFKTPDNDRDLPLLVLNNSSMPEECIRECRSRYYMFAGLMNGHQCYCGSKYGSYGPSVTCIIPCKLNENDICGGKDAMSIYSTGMEGPSPPRIIEAVPVESDGLLVTWQPPNNPNGNITSYSLSAAAIETYASYTLSSVESQVQGGDSNSTILRGLQAGSKYNISIIAFNSEGKSDPAFITQWTRIGAPNKPPAPKIIETTYNMITVLLSEGSSENGPVSSYQVAVVSPGTIPLTGSEDAYLDRDKSEKAGLDYYITGEFDASDFHKYQKFTIGNGRMIGGYYNIPLSGEEVKPQVGLVVVSRLGRDVRYAYSDLTSDLSLTSNKVKEGGARSNRMDPVVVALYVAIVLLGALLVGSIVLFVMLRRRHETIRMKKMPEAQELTLQGPMYEVDNLGYIPEDVPERVNHYQELKKKVWSIPQEALSIEPTVLRRGRFGTIHAGVVRKDGKTIAVAVHDIADGLLRASEKKNMLRELDVCIRVSPSNYLAGLMGTCETPSTLYVVLEMPPRTLKAKLLGARSGDIFPVERILSIGAGIAKGLRHLEYHKIVHDRLCARSVAIAEDWTPKVMGHGIARYALEDVRYARWTAAESFNGQKKQQSAVAWAFGVVLWEIFSMGGTPYSNLPMDSDVEDAVEKGVRLPQLVDVPDPIYEVMLSCWQVDPHERPTFDELSRLETLSICPITSITEPYVPELELN